MFFKNLMLKNIEVFIGTKLKPPMLQKKTVSSKYNQNTDKQQKLEKTTKIGLAYAKFN